MQLLKFIFYWGIKNGGDTNTVSKFLRSSFLSNGPIPIKTVHSEISNAFMIATKKVGRKMLQYQKKS